MRGYFAMRVLKESGDHLRNKARQNLIMVFLCFVVFAVIFISSVPILPLYIDVGRYEAARALSMVFPMIFGLQFSRQYRRYKSGFDGERRLTEYLKSALDEQYVLINDVNFEDGSGNIDHVLLGPPGIFVIETKNQRGWIECNGDVWNGIVGENPSRQARRNAVRISNVVASWVQGVVVFTNENVQLNIQNPIKVDVLKVDDLAKYLAEQTRRLSSQEIESMGVTILMRMQTSERS